MPMTIRETALCLALLALAACDGPRDEGVARGKQHYTTLCADCHGADGTGTGPLASALPVKPADLTRLSAGNGGSFPTGAVMAKIWGMDEASHRAIMPRFAALLEDDPVIQFDQGDGILTPTPARLVELAGYLRTLQR